MPSRRSASCCPPITGSASRCAAGRRSPTACSTPACSPGSRARGPRTSGAPAGSSARRRRWSAGSTLSRASSARGRFAAATTSRWPTWPSAPCSVARLPLPHARLARRPAQPGAARGQARRAAVVRRNGASVALGTRGHPASHSPSWGESPPHGDCLAQTTTGSRPRRGTPRPGTTPPTARRLRPIAGRGSRSGIPRRPTPRCGKARPPDDSASYRHR